MSWTWHVLSISCVRPIYYFSPKYYIVSFWTSFQGCWSTSRSSRSRLTGAVWFNSPILEESTKPNNSHFRPKSSSEPHTWHQLSFLSLVTSFLQGYICKRLPICITYCLRESPYCFIDLFGIKVFWNKVEYMWLCWFNRNKCTFAEQLALVSLPFRKSGWKRAIYYFPADDSQHGRPINARGPKYIYFHLLWLP